MSKLSTAEIWKQLLPKKAHGSQPRNLVFDSKLTTYANLARLDGGRVFLIDVVGTSGYRCTPHGHDRRKPTFSMRNRANGARMIDSVRL